MKKKYNERQSLIKHYLEDNNFSMHNKKIIHVTGTNGKGTTSHLIAAFLISNGYNVGIFSSPHMYSYNERIKINNDLISNNDLEMIKNKHQKFIDSNNLNYFEQSFIYAYDYFACNSMDFVIFEVGIGGKLDTTNIVNSNYCVITKIDIDHKEILGSNIIDITKDKIGIIHDESINFINENQNNKVNDFISNLNINFVSYDNDLLLNDILDDVMYENMNTAINVSKKLGININKNIVNKIYSQYSVITNFIGRKEIISNNPLIIYDIAHNYQSIENIINYYSKRNFTFYFSLNKNKDIDNILNLIKYKKISKNYINNNSINNLYIDSDSNNVFDNVYKSLDNIEFVNKSIILGSTYIYEELINKIKL